MALQLNTTPLLIPKTTEGIYILPYAWFEYGLVEGHLAIEDNAFFDTVQGSMYALAKQEKLPTVMDFGDGNCDVWLMYKPGTQEVNIIARPQQSKDGTWLYSKIKTPDGTVIRYISLDYMLDEPMLEQKEYNRTVIKLLKGCKIKLVRSVWQFNL